MISSLGGLSRVLCLIAVLCMMSRCHTASAVGVNFENPLYTAGPIVGQDGWVQTAYTGVPNGDLVVSTTGPLSGLQSLSYTRTEQGLAPTFCDVVKSDMINITKDGTAAADVNVSFQISSRSLSGQGLGFGVDGVILSYSGISGASPMGVTLNNAGSSIASIEIFADNGIGPANYYFGGTAASAFFPEDNTLEFKFAIDFDTSKFTVQYRNVTAGTPFTPSNTAYGFAVPYVANPNGSYDVDFVGKFRYGAGKIDNINMTSPIPEPATLSLVSLGVACMGLVSRRRR